MTTMVQIVTEEGMRAAAEQEKATVRQAVRIRVRSTMDGPLPTLAMMQEGKVDYSASTRLFAVMEDGVEVELVNATRLRWTHEVADTPRLLVEFVDVEIDAEAANVRFKGTVYESCPGCGTTIGDAEVATDGNGNLWHKDHLETALAALRKGARAKVGTELGRAPDAPPVPTSEADAATLESRSDGDADGGAKDAAR